MINISKNIGKGQVNLLCYQEDKNKLDGSPMKIQEVEITDIGGIPYLKLDNLDPHMNIICGENGVGKTNILNSIAHLFSAPSNESIHIVKKRAGTKLGVILLSFLDSEGEHHESREKVDVFMPEFFPETEFEFNSKYVNISPQNGIYMKVNRVFEYRHQKSIKRDPLWDLYGRDVVGGVSSKNLKSWFISRDLFDGKNYLSPEQRHNLQLAKDLIGRLDPSCSFSRIDTDHELMITTSTGEIYLEYLSSGFKSTFFILLGIIKEIEFKHGQNYIRADEYEGIILIDEIELHLHPEWQAKIIGILKESFPKAQFFITTHSPHVIQSAKYSEITALEKRTMGDTNIPFEVVKRDLPRSIKYGFQGWSIEEILTDVMGMGSTYGEGYLDQRRLFEEALDNNNREQAQSAFNEIVQMIHPNSPIKSIMEIKMVALGR